MPASRRPSPALSARASTGVQTVDGTVLILVHSETRTARTVATPTPSSTLFAVIARLPGDRRRPW